MHDKIVHAQVVFISACLDGRFSVGVLSVLQQGALGWAIKHTRKELHSRPSAAEAVCPEELVVAV